jgi:hypothetical protein
MGATESLAEKLKRFKEAKESGAVQTPKPAPSNAPEKEPSRSRALPQETKTGEKGLERPKAAKKHSITSKEVGATSLTTGNDKATDQGAAYLADPSLGGMGVSFSALGKAMPEIVDPSYRTISDPEKQGFESTAKGGVRSKKEGTTLNPLEQEVLAGLESNIANYAPQTLLRRRQELDTGYDQLRDLLEQKTKEEAQLDAFPTTALLKPFAGLLDFWYRKQPLSKAFEDEPKAKGPTALDRAIKLHEMKMKDKQSLTDDELLFLQTILKNKQTSSMESSLEGIRKRLEGATASSKAKDDLPQKRYDESRDKEDRKAALDYLNALKKDDAMLASFEKADAIASRYEDGNLPGYEKGVKIPDSLRSTYAAGRRAAGKETAEDRDYNDLRNAFETIKSTIRHSRYGSAQTVQETENLIKEVDDAWMKGPREFRNKLREVSRILYDKEQDFRSTLDEGAMRYVRGQRIDRYNKLGRMNFGVK